MFVFNFFHIGNDAEIMKLLDSFIVVQLLAVTSRMCLPNSIDCEGCQHNYPTMYHACVNYKDPYHWNEKGIAKCLLKGAIKMSKGIDNGRVLYKWKMFFRHVFPDLESGTSSAMTKGMWYSIVRNKLFEYAMNVHKLLASYQLLYDKFNSYDTVSLQDIVNVYQPNEKDEWGICFAGEYARANFYNSADFDFSDEHEEQEEEEEEKEEKEREEKEEEEEEEE